MRNNGNHPPVKMLLVERCEVAGCNEYQHHVSNAVVFRFCLKHLEWMDGMPKV